MTADSALKQIEEKNYDAKLLERGYKREAIQHYGFAFEGKKVYGRIETTIVDGKIVYQFESEK